MEPLAVEWTHFLQQVLNNEEVTAIDIATAAAYLKDKVTESPMQAARASANDLTSLDGWPDLFFGVRAIVAKGVTAVGVWVECTRFSAPQMFEGHWVDYPRYVANDKDLNRKDVLETAEWMKKGLKSATLQDFRAPPAEAVLPEPNSAASIAATVHALDPIQHQEGIATSAALAKWAVYEARSRLNLPHGDGMLSLRCEEETGAWDRCHHLLSRPVSRDNMEQAYDIVWAPWMDLPVACVEMGSKRRWPFEKPSSLESVALQDH